MAGGGIAIVSYGRVTRIISAPFDAPRHEPYIHFNVSGSMLLKSPNYKPN